MGSIIILKPLHVVLFFAPPRCYPYLLFHLTINHAFFLVVSFHLMFVTLLLTKSVHIYNSIKQVLKLTYRTATLTRFAIRAKGPDGKWTRKPLAYRESISVRLRVTRPPEICVQLVFKHIHAASGYTIRR